MANAIEVKVPDIGEFKDIPVIEVLVKPGDAVQAEDPLVTLESDKATMDVPSPAAGVVQSVVVKVGGLVSEGIPEGLLWPMIVGVVTAGVSGWLAVWALMRLIRTKSFDGFVVYRVLAGVGVLVVLASGWR